MTKTEHSKQSYITAIQYCEDIVSGKILSNEYVRLQCEAFVKELQKADTDDNYKWYFCRKRADRAILFFSRCLRLTEDKWAGEPFYLTPWQQFFVAAIFGWVSRANKKERRYNNALLKVGRKNGKTNLVAGMVLLAYILGDKGLQAFCAATKEDQANILHQFCKRMIMQSDRELRKLFKLKNRSIEIVDDWKTFKPLGKDSNTQDGFKPDVVAFDEAAAIKDPNVFNVLTSGQLASSNVLNILLTTAQDTVNPFFEMFEEPYINDLRNSGSDRTFGLIYTLDPEDYKNWDDPKLWIKANPNLGITVREDKMMETCLEARKSTIKKNSFMVKNLNVYLGSAESWLDVTKWDASGVDNVPISDDCFMTFDLSRSQDLTALAMWFRHPDGSRSVIHQCYIPKATFDALPTVYKVKYGRGIEEGVLTLVDGEIVDPYVIEDKIKEWNLQYRPKVVGFDRWSATMLTAKLAQDLTMTLEPINQNGMVINPAAMDFERLLNEGKIIHNKSSFISWQVANAHIRPDNKGNLYPQKESPSSPNKIDAVMTMVMACSLDIENPQQRQMYWGIA